MDRLRITYLITDTRIAGAERVLLDVIEKINRERFDPDLISLADNGDLLEEASRAGAPARTLGMRGPFDSIRLAPLVRRIRASRPHILHTVLFHANIAGRIAGKTARVPALVSSLHGAYRRRGYRRLEKATIPLADRVVSVSRAIRRLYFADGEREDFWSVIPNGIEARGPVTEEERRAARETIGLPPGSPLVVTAARLTPEKGLHHMIRAFPALLAEYPDARFWITGDGPLRSRLEKAAAGAGVSGRVLFLGRREDVDRVLLAGDLFVLPSLTEGMPRSLLEAANAEIPIIASRVGGIPEMVKDDESALLVPPGDGNGFARALIRLAGDRALSAKLAAEAKRVVRERFSLREMIRRHEDLYLDLAEEKGFLHREDFGGREG